MAGQLTIDTLKASSGVLATQNGMTGIAKAWVNFAGATGTVNGSFNVSSVTRTSTGYYTVNLTTAMPNTNYVINASCSGDGTTIAGAVNINTVTSTYAIQAPTTTAFILLILKFNGTAVIDPTYMNISVFSS